ncbi:MAG: hypothetical protein QOJ84_4214 [Bradyrhizobium sp.]|jgi:putative ABC transport system substrate-binding protein|nr:hypothetical protein [Bradyrhizobium sp.]
MKRRGFLKVAGGAALSSPLISSALSANKPYKIVRLYFAPIGPGMKPFDDGFFEGMRARGYEQGRDFIFERVSAEGRPELIAERVAEAVRRNPDVILTSTVELPLAIRKVSRTIPVVVGGAHDGVHAGLWESLSRPGGNTTGVETLAPDLDIKHFEIAKEIIPDIQRVTVLYNPDDPTWDVHHETCKKGAEHVGVSLEIATLRRFEDIDKCFQAIAESKPDALITVDHGLFVANANQIGAALAKHRIPSVHEFSLAVQAGGLASYGSNITSVFRRCAYFVDRILKGTNPADLPAELPDVYELAVNLKRAKELGITLPYSLVSRADKVIE